MELDYSGDYSSFYIPSNQPARELVAEISAHIALNKTQETTDGDEKTNIVMA